MVFAVKMVGQKKYFSNFLHTEKSAWMPEKYYITTMMTLA